MEVAGLHLPDGDDIMARKIEADGGLFDRQSIAAAMEHVADLSCAIDVGAHIGTWTRQLAGAFNEVLAFEPAPEMFKLLTRNTAGLSNVRAFPIALGPRSGRTGFTYEGVRHNSMGHCCPPEPGATWVPMMSIDAMCPSHAGLLKIDVEGLELHVIEGAAETLARCRPVVVIEENWCSVRYGNEPSAARNLLVSMGYAEAARVEFMPENFNVVMVPT